MLSVVIPAFNEEKRIAKTLEGFVSFLEGRRAPFEIIVVSDGTDNTPGVVKKFAAEKRLAGRLKLLIFNRRLGKGGALMKGLPAARGDVILMADADSSSRAEEMLKLFKALEHCDIAIGSRALKGSQVEVQLVRKFFGVFFNLLVRLLFSLPYADTQCGFKAFRAKALKKILSGIKTTDFTWDVDMLLQARKAALKVEEVPIKWHAEEGGSITYTNGLKVAVKMFFSLLKLKFS